MKKTYITPSTECFKVNLTSVIATSPSEIKQGTAGDNGDARDMIDGLDFEGDNY